MRLFKFVLVAALTAAPAMTFAQTTAQEQPKNPVVKREFKREFNQQRRIGNGIRNERFTPRQGARLERQQMRHSSPDAHHACTSQRPSDDEGSPHPPPSPERGFAQNLSRETPRPPQWVVLTARAGEF